jgi:hypothetical protein
MSIKVDQNSNEKRQVNSNQKREQTRQNPPNKDCNCTRDKKVNNGGK